MIYKYGAAFYSLAKWLNIYYQLTQTRQRHGKPDVKRMVEESKMAKVRIEDVWSLDFASHGLRLSQMALERFRALPRDYEDEYNRQRAMEMLTELDQRLRDELDGIWFKYLSEAKADLYNAKHPFGEEVANKCARAITDIEEAAKCLALDRGTATVFHLMRVMEIGLQSFGDKLGVELTQGKVWQVILDQVNKTIRAMPEISPQQKEIKSLYGEIASHLYNVKLAWRNPVMHPKSSYTLEEAEDIFKNVETFMDRLATKVL